MTQARLGCYNVALIYLRQRLSNAHAEVSEGELFMSLQDPFCEISLNYPNLPLFALVWRSRSC